MFETVIPLNEPTYRVHQKLEALFKEPGDTERRYVFMEIGDGGVLVRSPEPVGDLQWLEKATPEVGQTIRFFIRVIPLTRQGKNENRPQKKTVLKEIAQQKEWLRDRFAKNGLQLIDEGLIIGDYSTFIQSPKQTFLKQGIDVLGRAVITDQTLAQIALLRGIGEAKPYGFGTLVILEN